MTVRRRLAAALAAGLVLAGAPGAPPARACGFDGVFDGNFGVSHPLAMAVAVAIRQAVRDEVLPPDAAAPIVAGSAGLWQATARIHVLARGLGLAAPDDRRGVALHLADSGLWARLAPAHAGLAVEIHVDGPRPGEAIIITHGAVLERLVAMRMSARQALAHGLVAFDGADEAVAALRNRFVMLDDTIAAAATADLGQRLPWRAAAGRAAVP